MPIDVEGFPWQPEQSCRLSTTATQNGTLHSAKVDRALPSYSYANLSPVHPLKFALLLAPTLVACGKGKAPMLAFEETIPGTTVVLAMEPIDLGNDSKSFWIGKHEVTWDLYMLFQAGGPDPVDGITGPTTPYVPMDFGMGVEGYPAISMTHYAARQFCRWLSNRTGHFYRLPTAKEWTLACAGAKGGWGYENSGESYHQVGELDPNQYGLYDMLGNVAEWVDDLPESPNRAWGHLVLGGSWDDNAKNLSSSFHRQSKPSWQQQDPQIPRSIWFLTNAQTVGFRVIRPLTPPPRNQWSQYWNSSVESIQKIHARQQRGER